MGAYAHRRFRGRKSNREAAAVVAFAVLVAVTGHHTAVPAGHQAAAAGVTAADAPAAPSGGTLDCAGLEQLWEAAGGSPSAALMAASVAMAESSGQQDASSPAGDVGYWQINAPIWGPSLATTDPLGNARAAIQISRDGADWSPWVTYQIGAYQGKC